MSVPVEKSKTQNWQVSSNANELKQGIILEIDSLRFDVLVIITCTF